MSQYPDEVPLPRPQPQSMDNGRTDAVDVGRMHEPIVREQRDPRDGYEPVPLWLVALFGVLLFWGGWYLATYSGGFRGDVMDENPAVMYASLGNQPPATLDPMVLGERLYSSAGCVACHQSTGLGASGLVPPLAGSEWVQGDPARIKRIVLGGLSGPITVRSSTFNAEMPAFAGRLKDQQIAAILTFIRGNKVWGNSAGPISAESVAATRSVTAARATPWSAAELLAINHDEAAMTVAAAASSGGSTAKATAAGSATPATQPAATKARGAAP